MGYQNNNLRSTETPEDKTWIENITLASIPTNWSSLNGFTVVNYHAGREVAEVIDKTCSQIKRLNATPNKKVASMLGGNPQVWMGTREAMAVVHCNDPNGHTPEDMNVVFGIARRCMKNKESLPDDVARILERNLGKYQENFSTNKQISLDQAFGIENTREHSLDPHVISDTAFALVNELVFTPHLDDKGDLTDMSFVQAMRNLNETNIDISEIDLEDDEEWESLDMDDDKIKHRFQYSNHFKKYKYSALDYLLRKRLVNEKTHRYRISDIQLKVIKKHWKVDMPEVLKFNDEDYVNQILRC